MVGEAKIGEFSMHSGNRSVRRRLIGRFGQPGAALATASDISAQADKSAAKVAESCPNFLDNLHGSLDTCRELTKMAVVEFCHAGRRRGPEEWN